MLKKIAYLIPLAVLGACAYAIDGSVQDVKFETPGAQNAACSVYVEKLKYRVKPPQVLNLYKSRKDLIVDCMAPGNRRKIVRIPMEIEDATAWNATNAGVGLPWDYASGAMFRYPDVIEIDFRDVPVVAPALPAHNNPDIRQPEEYILEEFSPGAPRMNSDRNAPPIEILRRQHVASGTASMGSNSAFSEPAGGSQGKGDLMEEAQGLPADTSSMSSDGWGAPVPLIPGE